jgi:hypothetical protein
MMTSTWTTSYSLLALGTLALFKSFTNGQSTYPEYSQQCRDDAGPPFVDDGTWTYHEGSQATPVLMDDGECAPKMQSACEARGDSKKAYIEGPPDCGGNGWYCRILIQDGWDPMTLAGDLNFGYCNTTEGFNDPGYDQSGHCHGSDDDSTYYWWIRDHWYRGYNGRLRCCCNWSEGDSPLTDGKVTDRCDYRRLVVDEDDAASCRDANEDHDQSFEGGCTGPAELNEPIEEDDSMCWELHRFGYIDEYGEGGGNGGGDESETEDDEGDEEDDEDWDCRKGLRGKVFSVFKGGM